MRFLSGFLVALGVVVLGLVLIGDLHVDLNISLGGPIRPTPTPSPLVLHQSDNGKTVSVHVGQEVVVDLGANYGVPYSSNSQVLAPVGDTTPPYMIQGGGGGSASGGSGGNVSSGTSGNGGSFYCGVLPTQPSPATKPNCLPPCYCGVTCGGTKTACCAQNGGIASCPPPCPCGAYCAVTRPVPAQGGPGVSSPGSQQPASSPANMSGSSAGIANLYCPQPCYCRAYCPPIAGSAETLPTDCWPPCYCGTYCVAPMTGGATQTKPSGAGSAAGASSIYCPPCGNCPTYCVDPRMGTPVHSSPVQGKPVQASPPSSQPGYGSPSAIPGYSVAQVDAVAAPFSCGHGRWQAVEAGKADIIAAQGSICGGGIYCPMAGSSSVARLEFIVHVAVKQ